MDPSDVVVRFLESVGTRAETEYYLQLFRADSKERFATIAVDAAVVRHVVDALVFDLRYLASLGLLPVVLLGHVDPTEASEHADQLFRRLVGAGVPALVLHGAAPTLPADVSSAARAGALPIVKLTADAAPTLDERFARLGALVSALGTRKLIFLGRRGGFHTADGTRISMIPVLRADPSLEQGLSTKQRALLAQARRLLDEPANARLQIAVTSPLSLLRELFTVKGAGTMIRRGAVILRKSSFAEVDRPRLRTLLESSFERPVREGFFEQPVLAIFLEEEYRGAAVLLASAPGAFLTKFAVTHGSQGEGIGRDLWDAVCGEFPAFFWRARPDNPISAWYTAECDGMVRSPRWQVFWRGLAHRDIPEAIAFAEAAPVDFAAPSR